VPQVQYVPLPEGMTYDGGLYKQMPALVRDIKLNVSVVRTARSDWLLTILACPYWVCDGCGSDDQQPIPYTVRRQLCSLRCWYH